MDVGWLARPGERRDAPRLEAGQAHLWLVATAAAPAEPYQALLSSTERERADRFVFGRDRDAFVVAHGLTRIVLGGYADLDPAALRFTRSALGKPALDGAGDLCFNLSHAAGWLLVGVARGAAVGVDVEVIRPVPERDAIVAGNFTAAEQKAFAALPEQHRESAFFACWTGKEAVLKAAGTGITIPLDKVDVPVTVDGRHVATPAHTIAGLPAAVTLWSERRGDCWVALATAPPCEDVRLFTAGADAWTAPE